MPNFRDAALVKARALLAAVTFDSDGVMVGIHRVGGNGGLLSNESLRAADELRRAFDDLDHDPAPEQR